MALPRIDSTANQPIRLISWLLLALLTLGGCTTLNHSPLASRIAAQPGDYANVSVIFVEATPDLRNWGHMPELSGNFCSSGISAFYFDPTVHGDSSVLATWIAHEKSRGQKVMVVAWSYGMVCALDALKSLESRQICVDTLVSVDCFWLNWHRGSDLQPSNANRVVLIYRDQARLPEGFSAPVVHRIDTYRHLTMLGHQHTVDVLFHETMRLGEPSDQMHAATNVAEK